MNNNYIGSIKLLAISIAICVSSAALAKRDITIGSFNIKNFGIKKVSTPFVLEHLVKILSRYDISFLQEIRNKDQLAIFKLKAALDAYTGITHSIIISQPLGRASYKEQYAYIFNPKKIELSDYYVYNDGEEPLLDTFSREPFVAHFKVKRTKFRFAAIGAHIAPSAATSEIDELSNVYKDAKKRWKTENTIIMGDLNADCHYVDDYEESVLKLMNDSRFSWWIKKGEDTTVTENTVCAYDRIITTSTATKYTKDEKMIFNFTEAFGLSEDEANSISDHFPVEITLSI